VRVFAGFEWFARMLFFGQMPPLRLVCWTSDSRDVTSSRHLVLQALVGLEGKTVVEARRYQIVHAGE